MNDTRIQSQFLVACYATLHPALSVRPSIGSPFTASLNFLNSLPQPKRPCDLFYHCPCPPAHDWGSRVYGLVLMKEESVLPLVCWGMSWNVLQTSFFALGFLVDFNLGFGQCLIFLRADYEGAAELRKLPADGSNLTPNSNVTPDFFACGNRGISFAPPE